MSEQFLERLLAERDIERTLIAYCNALDRMDLPALAALFTEDCVVDYGDDARLTSTGAAALQKSLERMWRWSRTSHHLSNILIEFECATAARASSHVYAWHERTDGSSATIMGQYEDRLTCQAGRWLIARRRMVMNGCDAGFTVPIHRAVRAAPPSNWTAPDIDEPGPSAGADVGQETASDGE